MGRLMVGAAQVDITPELPVNLGGMFLSYNCSNILDRLYASSVSISNGRDTVIMVSCDLVCVTVETVSRIRRIVSERTGVVSNRIEVSATHTHTGPSPNFHSVYRSEIDEEKCEETLERIIKKVAESAIQAYENIRPARMGYGRGRAERCCFNRRYIMSDGRCRMNPFGVSNPDRLMVEGPIDEEMQVVWFEDMDGKLISIMVNMSSHAAILYGVDCISADFPGMMRKTLWNAMGEVVPVLYLQGACGNVDTFDFEHDEKWGIGLDGYMRVGRIVAGEVLKLVSINRAEMEDVDIAYANKVVNVAYKEFDGVEIKTAMEILSKALKSPDSKQYLYDRFKTLEERTNFNTLTGIEKMKKKYPEFPVEITVFRLGDVIFVTNPAELFVEYQLEIKKEMIGRKVIVTELTNGWSNYIPTRQAIALGGYETLQNMLESEAGNIIVRESLDLIQKLLSIKA